MLKLSALQPHLTAAEALNQRAAWVQGGRASKDSSHSGSTNRHARTQDWHAQGQELTGIHQPKRQLSVCIQLEVKLAEALDKCDSLCPPQADDHGQLLPNKLRTAVCCKVLTDLCNVSGPFSKVLRTVRTELVRSVYSDYYAMEQQGLQFSQLPYYKAAERLEADNKHLLQEKESFKKVLLRRQEEVAVIEGQVAELKGLVQQQDALNAGLQQRVQTASEAEARAKVEAGAAKDELKRLRKEMLRLKNEWSSLRALYESAKVREQQASESFEVQVAELRESVRAGVEEAAELRAKLATVVPREQLTAAEQRIKELEKMVQQARRESVKADDLLWLHHLEVQLLLPHQGLQRRLAQTLQDRQLVLAAAAQAEHGEQAAVAQEGYSFLYALRQYQHQLAMADIFLRVVEGQWQEGVWHDCRHMLQGVALVLDTLSDSQPEGVHSLVSVVDIQLVLQHLFPLKSEADVSAAIKAVSSANQITISAMMPIHRSSGQWASATQPPSASTGADLFHQVVYSLVQPQGALQAHGGMADMAQELYKQLECHIQQAKTAGQTICFGGHSLGGALATLVCCHALLQLRLDPQQVQCVTFGSPPVLAHRDGKDGNAILQMLGLPSAGLRSYVLDSDPIPRAMLSIDPTFSFFKEWPAVKGLLQMRQWFMGQTSAPLVNPARFLYDNVGEVFLIKWTVGQGHKVQQLAPAQIEEQLKLADA
ncbi:hypothetical protein WJX82_010947 [Trebouxia sp. C0006]